MLKLGIFGTAKDFDLMQKFLLYSPIYSIVVILKLRRGVRYALFPAYAAFCFYTVCQYFIEPFAYFIYVLGTGLSLVLYYFYCHFKFYNEFPFSNEDVKVGLKYVYLEKSNNKVNIYYPAEVKDENLYDDVPW